MKGMDSNAKELSEAEKEMTNRIFKALKGNDEQEQALKPMITNTLPESKLEGYISSPSENPQSKPIEKIATETLLDELFYNENHQTLGGIPFGSQFGVLGLADSGKSILVQEIALKLSHKGKHILFITSEDIWNISSPRLDLESRCKQKAEILGLEWNKIRENLTVMDTITHSELRSWSTFAETYRYICETRKIDFVIIDSITLLETYRGALKYRLLELIRYNQIHGITALYVCQRSMDEWDSYKIAGGMGIAHNLDGTIVVDFGKAWNSQVKYDLNVKQGTFVRIIRIFGNRLGDFDRRYHEVEITNNGFLRFKTSLQQPTQT